MYANQNVKIPYSLHNCITSNNMAKYNETKHPGNTGKAGPKTVLVRSFGNTCFCLLNRERLRED
jgi:hypothetical protein